MIAYISFSPSYAQTLGYCLHDKRVSKEERERKPDEERKRTQNRAEVLYYNRCCGDHRELARQFREVQKLNYNIRKPVLHLALSLPPGEHISKAGMVQLAKDCAKALDFEQHQYVVILHKDTEHRHAHLVVNRIGFDKHTVVNQYLLQKVNAYCRAAELRYDLRPTKAMRRYRSPGEKMLPSEDGRVRRLAEQIHGAIHDQFTETNDLDTFKKKMRQRGYRVYKTDRGISFKDADRVLMSGSDAGYPWKKIEADLDLNLKWREFQLAQRPKLTQEEELKQRQRRTMRIPL